MSEDNNDSAAEVQQNKVSDVEKSAETTVQISEDSSSVVDVGGLLETLVEEWLVRALPDVDGGAAPQSGPSSAFVRLVGDEIDAEQWAGFVGVMKRWIRVKRPFELEEFSDKLYKEGSDVMRKPPTSAEQSVHPQAQGSGAELEGNWRQVAEAGMNRLRSHRNEPEFTIGFASKELAEAVERLVKEDEISPMQQVDLMVHLFAGEPVYRVGSSPQCTPSFRWFMAHLRRILTMQETEEQDRDFHLTKASLVAWYGQGGSDECKICGIELGLELLSVATQENGSRYVYPRSVHGTGNNLTSWVDALTRDRKNPPAGGGSWAGRVNSIHALATVAFIRDKRFELVSDEDIEAISSVFSAFGIVSGHPDGVVRKAQAIRFMNNMNMAWRYLGDMFKPLPPGFSLDAGDGEWRARYRSAVFAALSAPIRTLLGGVQDSDEVVSSLFNTGVGVSAVGRGRMGSSVPVAPVRVLVNALGLWWAMSRGRHDSEVFGSFYGSDCAVNLFAAVSDMSCIEVGDPAFNATQSLGDALYSAMIALGLTPDAMRFERSFNKLFGRSPGQGLPIDTVMMREQLLKVVGPCLESKLPEIGRRFEELRVDNFADQVAGLLRDALRSEVVLGAETGLFDQVVDGWGVVLSRLVDLAGQTDEGFVDFRGVVPASLAELELDAGCDDVDESEQAWSLADVLRAEDRMRDIFMGPSQS